MIDTDKYTGHTEGPWKLSPDDWVWAEHLFKTNIGNAMLITDAPLLLEEVKRLREGIKRLLNEGSPDRIWVHNTDLRELIE
jgi:hypothetical protein